MDWSKGFSSRYYGTLVDKETWRDTERFELTGGSVKRITSNLRQSADIDVGSFDIDGEKLIRVWLEATQNGTSSRIALFTGYATPPARDIDGFIIRHSLECYSVLKPASDILLPRGWYAPVGVDVIWQIRELLKVTHAPIEVMGDHEDLTLHSAIVAEQNETNLTMVELLLKSIGWRLIIERSGKIILCPMPTEPVALFDSRDNDIVEPQIKDKNDWYDCPNVFRAVMDETSAEWRDEDPESKYSIPSRGREIWAEETSCKLNDKETLADYARRRLKELQQVGREVSYDRRFRPDIMPEDIVQLNYPAQGLVGQFTVTSQTITLGLGAKTAEEVKQI